MQVLHVCSNLRRPRLQMHKESSIAGANSWEHWKLTPSVWSTVLPPHSIPGCRSYMKSWLEWRMGTSHTGNVIPLRQVFIQEFNCFGLCETMYIDGDGSRLGWKRTSALLYTCFVKIMDISHLHNVMGLASLSTTCGVEVHQCFRKRGYKHGMPWLDHGLSSSNLTSCSNVVKFAQSVDVPLCVSWWVPWSAGKRKIGNKHELFSSKPTHW